MITNALIFFGSIPFGFFGWKYREDVARWMFPPRRRRFVADPLRIHRLEYELGFRDDPPPLRTNPVHAILRDQWTSGLPPKTAKALLAQSAIESGIRKDWPIDVKLREVQRRVDQQKEDHKALLARINR